MNAHSFAMVEIRSVVDNDKGGHHLNNAQCQMYP